MNVGVRREAFGDIISDGDKWQVFIAQEVAGFVVNQVDKIGKNYCSLRRAGLYTNFDTEGWLARRANDYELFAAG